MLLKIKLYWLFLITGCFCISLFTVNAYAQDTTAVKGIITSIEKLHERLPIEKLYLQFDRPYYATGDTIWFKTYLLNAATYTPSQLSSKIYVELVNDSNKVVNRFAVPIAFGLGQGTIVLDDKVPDGSYTVRAYTNWMQNAGEEAFFNKRFYVGKPSAQGGWLINEQHNIKASPAGNQVNLALQLTDLVKMAIPYRDIELKLIDDKKTVLKTNHVTSDQGSVSTSFMLPSKVKTQKLSLIITDKTTKNKFVLPFYPGGPLQKIDMQFMPEGGSLVAGIANRVGFKAIGDDGLGVDVTGSIVNQNGEEVSKFKSLYKGMGKFILLPQPGQTYTAKFTVNGIEDTAALPLVNTSGIVFRVDNLSSADTIFLHLRATPDVALQTKTYSIIASANRNVYYGIPLNLKSGFSNIRLPKSTFSTGIVNFSVLDAENNTINERKVFIDHNDRLKIDITNSQAKYLPKDSIALTINVTNVQGNAVRGSFAASVTDDSFIKGDIDDGNIISSLLLTSELKGNVEFPEWYFTKPNENKTLALDNLMLTQGWTGLNLDLLKKPLPVVKFAADAGNNLTGKLTNLFNKPVKKAKLNLFSVSQKYGVVVYDTLSNDAGEFVFKNLPLFDTIAYTLRVNNKDDKASTANIKLDEFIPAKIATYNNIRQMPWFVQSSNSLMLNYFNQDQPSRIPGIDARVIKGKLLKEVNIKAHKPNIIAGKMMGYVIKEIPEKELVEARKMTLYDLIVRKLRNFGTSHFYKENMFTSPAFHDNPALVVGLEMIADIIVDGQGANVMFGSTSSGAANEEGQVQMTIDFLKYMSADEVKDVKIAGGSNMFITVTTRSGNSYFTRTSPNIIQYRPVPLCLPRQFYRPRYPVKNNNPTGVRPTIHWEPNLITNKDGKAVLSFYGADKPGTYTIIVEGTDMQGNIGYQTSKIVIAPPGVNMSTN
ncbi:hypothetical protein FFF34_008410 [Inquilinus sp. KBS0705]|nr:hypothetical protein FFF34_008410 [Inquilinus sp. KBS0705]